MSGKPWPPERKAAFAAEMRRRWRGGQYDKRRPPAVDAAERARRAEQMRRLNQRMAFDDTLKARCIAGMKRSRRRPGYRKVQSAVMAEIMARPEMRRRARFHAIKNNKSPRTRKRMWASRVRKYGPRGRRAKAAA